nr:hypothetical protein [Tanacetum cinerariifolium]
MSSTPPEDHSNSKTTSATTSAFQKKRSRRVSFAENTIHIFERDEESGSIPDEDGGSSDRDSVQLFRNESEGDDEEEEEEEGSPFFRVVRSPSSGGSTVGSATSNDDDNFFGPVSTSFIRRNLSDSAASDDNHEQTMDSTAFSMHFRSIAGSVSDGELVTSTPTGPTPSSVPSNTGSSMPLTIGNKPNDRPNVSYSNLSSGTTSNDMSLVGEYHNKYNYGNLSPALNALLT